MPNIAQVLKEEIRRLARKEVKAATASLARDNTQLRRAMAGLRKRLASAEKAQKILQSELRRGAAGAMAELPDEGELKAIRVTGKMIRKMRARLGVSQAELARLLGVSGQSVYQWERKGTRLRLRDTTKAALQRVRTMGRREIRQELQGEAAARKLAKKAARKKAAKKK